MDRTYQLSELPGLVAMVRMRGQAVRLVLRNSDRFGLVHLYFSQGHVVHVAGHAGSPAAALGDLVTWDHAAIRIDDAGPALGPQSNAADLEPMVSRALEELLRRGVAHPAPPVVAGAPRTGAISPMPTGYVPSAGRRQRAYTSGPSPARPGGFDHGADTRETSAHRAPRPASAMGSHTLAAGHLSEPQWQLLGLIVHQIVEQAGHLLGPQMVDTALREALARQGGHNRLLARLDFDHDGWLQVSPPGSATMFTTEEIAAGMAGLLTDFEARCAEVLGAHRAKQLIATAAAPFRASLEQIGIVISPP